MKITPARVAALLLCVGVVLLGGFVSGLKRSRFGEVSHTITLRVSPGYAKVFEAEWKLEPPSFSSTLLDPDYPEAKVLLTCVAEENVLRVPIPQAQFEKFDLTRLRWVSKTALPPTNPAWTPNPGSIQAFVKQWWHEDQRARAEKMVADRRHQWRAIESRAEVWARSGRTIWLEVEDLLHPPGTFAERAHAMGQLVDRLDELALELSPPPRPRAPARNVSFEPGDLDRWIADPSSLLSASLLSASLPSAPPPSAPSNPPPARSLPDDLESIVASLSLPDEVWSFNLGPRKRRLRIQRVGGPGCFVALHPRETLGPRLESAAVDLQKEWGTPREREAIDRAIDELDRWFRSRVAFDLEPAPLPVTLRTLGAIETLVRGKRVNGPHRLVITSDPLRPTGWTATQEDPKRLEYITELVIPYTPDPGQLRDWLVTDPRDRRGIRR